MENQSHPRNPARSVRSAFENLQHLADAARASADQLLSLTTLTSPEEGGSVVRALKYFNWELPKDHRRLRYRAVQDLDAFSRADIQAMRILFRLLRRISSEEERQRIAMEAVETGNSIHGVVHFASSLQLTDEAKHRGREPELSEDGRRQVAAAALMRIRKAAEDGTLAKGPHLAHTLFRWREWSGEEEPRSYVRQLIVSDDGLVGLLNGFLSQRQSHAFGEHVTRTTWAIDRRSIGQFIDIEELLGRAQQISKSLDSKEKRAVDALLKSGEEEE